MSQAFQRLEANGLVDTTGELADRTSAIDWWLEHYRLPTEAVETHWYGLEDPRATTGHCTPRVGPGRWWCLAPWPPTWWPRGCPPDVLAPWLPPDRVVVYAARGDWLCDDMASGRP